MTELEPYDKSKYMKVIKVPLNKRQINKQSMYFQNHTK